MTTSPIHLSHPKPLVPRRLVIVFSLCLFFVVLYAALLTVMRQQSLYVHITDPVQRQENARILNYLNGPLFASNTLDFLTPSEQLHMSDVKRLFDIAFIIYLVCLGIIIGTVIVFFSQRLWQRFDELLARSLRAVGWVTIGVGVLLTLSALLDFTKFWVLFHVFFFPQGNWMFSADSILITLYPESFFSDLVLHWLVFVSAFGVVALIVSFFMLHMRVAEHAFDAFKEGPQAQQMMHYAHRKERKAEKGDSPKRKR